MMARRLETTSVLNTAPLRSGGGSSSSISTAMPTTSIPALIKPLLVALAKYSVGLGTETLRTTCSADGGMAPSSSTADVPGIARTDSAGPVTAVVARLRTDNRADSGLTSTRGGVPATIAGNTTSCAVFWLNCNPPT